MKKKLEALDTVTLLQLSRADHVNPLQFWGIQTDSDLRAYMFTIGSSTPCRSATTTWFASISYQIPHISVEKK